MQFFMPVSDQIAVILIFNKAIEDSRLRPRPHSNNRNSTG